MIRVLGRDMILILSFIFMLIMFITVMFVVNPLIDGENGLGVIALQLSFKKTIGIELINNWGKTGINNFKKWIFTDYLYAIAYSVFLASILSSLIIKKGKEKISYIWVVYLVFVAGLFDCIENTIEIMFLKNPTDFSDSLYFLHSIIALIKWSALPIIIIYIVFLLLQKNKA